MTEAAYRILRACEARFASWDPQRDSIQTGVYHDPTGENTEVPIIYDGCFLIEAVLRLKGRSCLSGDGSPGLTQGRNSRRSSPSTGTRTRYRVSGQLFRRWGS